MLEVVTLLLDSTIVNAPDNDGETPLHKAASRGKLDVMELLIMEYSANMDAPNKYGQTPRNMLAKEEKFEALEQMLEKM